MFLRRVFGAIMLFAAVTGIAISIALIVLGRQAIDDLAASANEMMSLAGDSLTNSQQLLVLAKSSLAETSRTLEAVDETVVTVAGALDGTQPVLQELTTVTTADIPANIEAIQMALPDIVAATGAIDETLRLLNSFQISESILGIPIHFDLGINYNPERPIDETVRELGESLEGMPERLRALETDANLASDNLAIISGDLRKVSTDIDTLGDSLNDIEPFLDEYLRLTNEGNDRILQLRARLNRDVVQFKMLFTLGMVWLGLAQIAPLYLGALLLAGRSMAVSRDRVIIDAPRED